MKKKLLIIVLFIILISTFFIIAGMYFVTLSKPKNIISFGINNIKNKTDKYLLISNDLILGDNINIVGNIDFDLDSEYYKRINSKEYNIIKNLTNSDINFSISEDAKKEKGLVSIKHNIDEEKIWDFKYYVDDATKYYYDSSIMDSYINDGTCYYFENINSNNTTDSNIKYLYNFMFKSLKNSLKDEYFTTEEKNESINGKKTNVHMIELTLDNKRLNEINSSIISSFKKDKKANRILNNLEIDLNKYKNKELLGKDEKYILNIYTTKLLYSPLKYEITHIKGNDKEVYIYEGNESKGKFYYYDNSELVYRINIKTKNNDLDGIIYDKNNKKIGEFRLDKNKHNVNFTYSYNKNNEKYDLVYSSKYTSIKKDSYKNEKILSFKHVKDKEDVINGSITLVLKVNDKPKIDEDINKVILKNNLSDKEKAMFNNKFETIKNRLEK